MSTGVLPFIVRKRNLTIDDIIQHYLVTVGSIFCPKTLAMSSTSPTMWSEMNEIKKYYQDCLLGKSPCYTMKDIVRMCVRGLYSTGHQRRVKVNAIDDAVDSLYKENWIFQSNMSGRILTSSKRFNNKFSDFEELYSAVRQIIGGISGIGFVTIYDTARRIGHLLSNPIYPEAYVYLHHNKVNKAACSILNKSKLNYREPSLVFCCPFGKLPSIYIEDLLCVYSDIFVEITVTENDSDETVKKSKAKRWQDMSLDDFINKMGGKAIKAMRWPEFSSL